MIIGCNFIRAMYGGVRIEGDNVTFYKNVITIQTRQSVNPLEAVADDDFISDHYYDLSTEWIFHSVEHNPSGSSFDNKHPKVMKQLLDCGIVGDDPMRHWSLNQITCKLDLKVYVHRSEEAILCVGDTQIERPFIQEESYEELQRSHMQYIHLGVVQVLESVENLCVVEHLIMCR